MGGDEGLRLRGHGSEDAILVESLTVGASTILRAFEARASDLATRVSSRGIPKDTTRLLLTFRLRQYRQAMAVRCLGAG